MESVGGIPVQTVENTSVGPGLHVVFSVMTDTSHVPDSNYRCTLRLSVRIYIYIYIYIYRERERERERE